MILFNVQVAKQTKDILLTCCVLVFRRSKYANSYSFIPSFVFIFFKNKQTQLILTSSEQTQGRHGSKHVLQLLPGETENAKHAKPAFLIDGGGVGDGGFFPPLTGRFSATPLFGL